MSHAHPLPERSIDEWLILEVESLADGAAVHGAVNLIHAYMAATAEYNVSRKEEYAVLAEDAETSLRKLLVLLRLRRALSAGLGGGPATEATA